jgi:hypothetical protein
MRGIPNEEKPVALVSASYTPPSGVRYPVKKGDTWITIARSVGIDPWDLIDFNFPGTKRVHASNPERASRQVNWYLREYVGCKTTLDGENWAFDTGLTKGLGSWRGGIIYTPLKSPPSPPPAPPRRCLPTSSGKLGRRPTFYRLLTETERAMVARVFRQTLPPWETIGIGDGLGFDGRPWTDHTPMEVSDLPNQLHFELNLGDAAREDLTLNQVAGCFVTGILGTLSDLLIHEMTHVWQYHNVRSRVGLWVSSVFGSYDFKPGGSWDSYGVEQQASIVERWHHDGELKTHALYPYIQLVVRTSGGPSMGDALEYASTLTLNELNRDLADLRARGLDR